MESALPTHTVLEREGDECWVQRGVREGRGELQAAKAAVSGVEVRRAAPRSCVDLNVGLQRAGTLPTLRHNKSSLRGEVWGREAAGLGEGLELDLLWVHWVREEAGLG